MINLNMASVASGLLIVGGRLVAYSGCGAQPSHYLSLHSYTHSHSSSNKVSISIGDAFMLDNYSAP